MASSEQQCIRFFVLACCFGLLVGVIGCATNNWSKPLFDSGAPSTGLEQNSRFTLTEKEAPEDQPQLNVLQRWNQFWSGGFGSSAGLDPTARDIERSLGY